MVVVYEKALEAMTPKLQRLTKYGQVVEREIKTRGDFVGLLKGEEAN